MSYEPRLKKLYKEEITKKLQDRFNYSSPMEVPRLVKISINRGVGSATSDKKLIETSISELSSIAGQKAVATYSRVDVSNFKLRKGVAIGTRVTLRSDRMYEFLDRLVSISLPRTRDFKGVNNKFDGRGNYTMGIKEHIIFPEIDIDKVNNINGMDISFVTTANTDEEGYALLEAFGIPFKK